MITAVFNDHATVRDALDSLFAQSHLDIESIVIDGGSVDGTLDILRAYKGRVGVLLSEPDRGIYDAFNKGVLLTTGDVVGFLNADDLLADTDALSKIAAVFSDPLIDAVYGDLLYVCRDNCEQIFRYWESGLFTRRKLGWGWMPPHSALYLRRGIYERFGLFDVSYRIAGDYDFILRVLGSGIRAAYLPEVLVKMRVGGASNRSLANILQKSAEDLRALKSNRIGGVGALAWKNVSKLPQFIKR